MAWSRRGINLMGFLGMVAESWDALSRQKAGSLIGLGCESAVSNHAAGLLQRPHFEQLQQRLRSQICMHKTMLIMHEHSDDFSSTTNADLSDAASRCLLILQLMMSAM